MPLLRQYEDFHWRPESLIAGCPDSAAAQPTRRLPAWSMAGGRVDTLRQNTDSVSRGLGCNAC